MFSGVELKTVDEMAMEMMAVDVLGGVEVMTDRYGDDGCGCTGRGGGDD